MQPANPKVKLIVSGTILLASVQHDNQIALARAIPIDIQMRKCQIIIFVLATHRDPALTVGNRSGTVAEPLHTLQHIASEHEHSIAIGFATPIPIHSGSYTTPSGNKLLLVATATLSTPILRQTFKGGCITRVKRTTPTQLRKPIHILHKIVR
jgi:hypothetical protein